jgi:hypothetical protein
MTFIIDSPKYGKHEVVIDDEDWLKVKAHKWHLKRDKNKSGELFYAAMHIHKNGKQSELRLHIMITGWKACRFLDGNGLNCQKNNLRERTSHVYSLKSRTSIKSKSKYRGVYTCFRSQIRVDRKTISLGIFDSAEEAAIAYNKAAIKYHGEFASLNKIEAIS